MISGRIFALLKEKKISQKEFSEMTGIAQSTISDWKRKKTNPASDKLMAICNALQISPYELLLGAEEAGKYQIDYVVVSKESSDYQILEQYHALPQAGKERLLGYLQVLGEEQGQNAEDGQA